MKHTKTILVIVAVVALLVGGGLWFFCNRGGANVVVQESDGIPITTFNLTFRVGSADDPVGSEGLAHLTANLMREGGVEAWEKMPARTRAELEDFLFPFASEIDVSVQKEQISLTATASAVDAPTIFRTMAQMILAPAFNVADFERLKAETLDALEKQYPREDQEELGKAALDQAIYGKNHPYGHVVQGTVKGVKGLTIEKVREFYRAAFVQKRLVVGMGGVANAEARSLANSVFDHLPKGSVERAEIPAAKANEGLRLVIVKGPFEATGVHLGQAIPVTRANEDFPALYLASIAFGKHRSFVGRLMKNVREIRGLNYGAYAYAEDFPQGGRLTTEPTQAARSRQAFTLWGRPTPLVNGCFLMRQLLREVTNLAQEGLTPGEFELGHSHLVGNIPLLATGLERSLGYTLDSRFYGIQGDYLKQLQANVQKSTRDSVNATVRKHLLPASLTLVVVTPDPEKFKAEITGPRCNIEYGKGIQKPAEVLAEDEKIATFPVKLSEQAISVVTSESVFAE